MINLRVTGFDWDGGNRAKCQKHGVSIVEIEALFIGNPRVAPAPETFGGRGPHDRRGTNQRRKAPVCGFTLRTKNRRRLIRPVTASYMHAKEIAAYEKEESSKA